MIILEHEDIVNMVCGLPCDYSDMSIIDECTGKRLYSYHGGFSDSFEWNRAEVERTKTGKLIELYTKIKSGREETVALAAAEVQNEAKMKRCYYKCGNCGSLDIGAEDKFCPACGFRLKRQTDEA